MQRCALAFLVLLVWYGSVLAGGLTFPGGGGGAGGGAGSASELTFADDACVTATDTQNAVEQAAQRICSGTLAAREAYFTAPVLGQQWYVTDGTTATDCATGGEVTTPHPVRCIYNGAEWVFDVAQIIQDTIDALSDIDASVRDASANTNLVTRDLGQTVATQQVTADTNTLSCGTILYASYTLLVSTNSGAINLVSNPQVADGTNHQLCMLCGTSDANYPILEDGNGLDLRSAANMQNLFCLQLQYVQAEDVWRERWRTPTAAVGGTDTQCIFMDGATPNGDAGCTYNKTTKVLTATGGFVSVCDPATENCVNEDVEETTALTDPIDTSRCRWQFRNNVLEWFCGGDSLKRVDTDVDMYDYHCDEADGTSYLRTISNSACSTTETFSNEALQAVMRTGVIQYITCIRDGATGSGNTRTYTPRVNATTTSNAVCTMANAASCVTTSGTTAVTAGDQLSVVANETGGTPGEQEIVCKVGIRVN